MPYRFYQRRTPLIHLIAIDTFELAKKESMDNSISMGMSSARFNRIYAELSKENQLEWLERALSSSTSTWKIVIGHYPIFSNGVHGNTEELYPLAEMFKKYKVNLYVSGHDHNICHREDGGVHHIVSGCGCRKSPIRENELFTPLPDVIGTAFIKVHETLEFGFYSQTGDIVFQMSIRTS